MFCQIALQKDFTSLHSFEKETQQYGEVWSKKKKIVPSPAILSTDIEFGYPSQRQILQIDYKFVTQMAVCSASAFFNRQYMVALFSIFIEWYSVYC